MVLKKKNQGIIQNSKIHAKCFNMNFVLPIAWNDLIPKIFSATSHQNYELAKQQYSYGNAQILYKKSQ
jgi:hypothetical protein